MKKKMWVVLLFVLLGTMPSFLIAQSRSILMSALHSEDAEVIAAAQLLQERGLLRSTKNDSVKASSLAFSSADCTMTFRQHVLNTALARNLTKGFIPKQVQELAATFEPAGVRLKGKIDGPLFVNPSFDALVELRLVRENVLDVVVVKSKVGWFDMRRFAGFVYAYVEGSIKQQFGQFADCRDMGAADDGSYVIRVTFKPAGFAPFVGDHAKLTAVKTGAGELRLAVHLKR